MKIFASVEHILFTSISLIKESYAGVFCIARECLQEKDSVAINSGDSG
jgi:hypothetical protein